MCVLPEVEAPDRRWTAREKAFLFVEIGVEAWLSMGFESEVEFLSKRRSCTWDVLGLILASNPKVSASSPFESLFDLEESRKSQGYGGPLGPECLEVDLYLALRVLSLLPDPALRRSHLEERL